VGIEGAPDGDGVGWGDPVGVLLGTLLKVGEGDGNRSDGDGLGCGEVVGN